MLPVFRGDFFPSFDVENLRQDFLGRIFGEEFSRRIFGEEFSGKNFWGRTFGEEFLGKNFGIILGRIMNLNLCSEAGGMLPIFLRIFFEASRLCRCWGENKGKCCPFFCKNFLRRLDLQI